MQTKKTDLEKKVAEAEHRNEKERADYQEDLNQLNADKRSLAERKEKMKSVRAKGITEEVLKRWRWNKMHEAEAVKCIDQQYEAEQEKLQHESKVIQHQQGGITHGRADISATKASSKVGQLKFTERILNEKRMNRDSCQAHAERRAACSVSSRLKSIQEAQIHQSVQHVVSQLDGWFEAWNGDDWEAHQQIQEDKVWKLIQTASPQRPASTGEIKAVVDAWQRVSSKLAEWVQDDSSAAVVDSQVIFDLAHLAKPAGIFHSLEKLNRAMEQMRFRRDVQEALMQELEKNAQVWARQRLVRCLFKAYERVQKDCPQWHFGGVLQPSILQVVKPIASQSFPKLHLPVFQELRKKLSNRLSSAIGSAVQKVQGQPFPLEIPPGSVLEKKLNQGPGRSLLRSLQESWGAEFERSQGSEVLAKQILKEERRQPFAKLVFQEAVSLREIVLESWKRVLCAVSDFLPEDARGEAFKALQVTCAAGTAQRARLVALLAAPPGQLPDLNALNPFFKDRTFGPFPHWTVQFPQSQIPAELKNAMRELVQLQGLATSLCRVAQELNGEISATLQRQVADLLEMSTGPKKPLVRDEWLQFEWEQRLVCRPVQLHVATKMMSPDFDKKVLQLNMGEGKSKVILCASQSWPCDESNY